MGDEVECRRVGNVELLIDRLVMVRLGQDEQTTRG